MPTQRDESLKIRLTALRLELREQIGVVVETAQLLLDSRGAAPAGFEADVGRILTAARRLLTMVDEAFGPEALEAGPIDTEALGSHLRHELRTPLNHVIGYSEMLLEDAESEGDDAEADPEASSHVAEAESIQVIVVADADLLQDQLWVEKRDFFGTTLAQVTADNGAFLVNAVENMSGDADLISLRSRGRSHGPIRRRACRRGSILPASPRVLHIRTTVAASRESLPTARSRSASVRSSRSPLRSTARRRRMRRASGRRGRSCTR